MKTNSMLTPFVFFVLRLDAGIATLVARMSSRRWRHCEQRTGTKVGAGGTVVDYRGRMAA